MEITKIEVITNFPQYYFNFESELLSPLNLNQQFIPPLSLNVFKTCWITIGN